MTGSQESVEEQQRLDELRRRLYRDGATDEDLRRYAEVRDAQLDSEEAPTGSTGVTTGRRRPRLLAAASAAAVLLVVAVGIAATSPAPPSAARTPPPTTAARATAPPQDIGEGQTLTQDAKVTGPRSEAVSIEGTAAVAQQFEGRGAAVVALDLSSAPFKGGRAVVVLSSTNPSPIAWRALRLATRPDWTSYEQVVARSAAADRASIPRPDFFTYAGAPPSRIAIEAPSDLRWTLLVAFTARTAPHLR